VNQSNQGRTEPQSDAGEDEHGERERGLEEDRYDPVLYSHPPTLVSPIQCTIYNGKDARSEEPRLPHRIEGRIVDEQDHRCSDGEHAADPGVEQARAYPCEQSA
jgi:hypothetical protein